MSSQQFRLADWYIHSLCTQGEYKNAGKSIKASSYSHSQILCGSAILASVLSECNETQQNALCTNSWQWSHFPPFTVRLHRLALCAYIFQWPLLCD